MKKLFILLVILLLLYNFWGMKIDNYKHGIPEVKFPFKNLFDENGEKLNIILISAPFRSEEDENSYKEYKEMGLDFCGISSYLEFPNKIDNPYEDKFHIERGHNYLSMVSAWLHCFREPSEYLSGIPNMLLTEADLKNTDVYKPDHKIQKEYDFMYVCLKDNDSCEPGWQSYNRNWDLAKECLVIMCRDYGLKGVIIGRENCKITEFCEGIVKLLPFLPFHEFQTELQKSRFLFVPNISDASPRVITEAFCYDIPALVNWNIVGGWHNVIPGITGEFFTNTENLIPALNNIQNTTNYSPRSWYIQNRGVENSGRELANFLRAHFPRINKKEVKTATITV